MRDRCLANLPGPLKPALIGQPRGHISFLLFEAYYNPTETRFIRSIKDWRFSRQWGTSLLQSALPEYKDLYKGAEQRVDFFCLWCNFYFMTSIDIIDGLRNKIEELYKHINLLEKTVADLKLQVASSAKNTESNNE